MVLSYAWGQKEYKIPYATKKLLAYMVLAVLLFFIHKAVIHFFTSYTVNLVTATVLLFGYVWFVYNIERKEFAKILNQARK